MHSMLAIKHTVHFRNYNAVKNLEYGLVNIYVVTLCMDSHRKSSKVYLNLVNT